ncbi:glycosyltransferase, partial [bacterium]|nr:glycosyltransferase [bacterium]
MTLSLLILTQNRHLELIQCLSSLESEIKNLLEIIVMDNGSDPPLPETALAGFPQLKILRSDKNLGVAKGRNILAEEARGELLWFLDDDAVLESVGACQLIQSYFEKSSIGVVSFKVINELTGQEEVRCIPDRKKGLTESDLPASYFVGC